MEAVDVADEVARFLDGRAERQASNFLAEPTRCVIRFCLSIHRHRHLSYSVLMTTPRPNPCHIDLYSEGSCIYRLDRNGEIVSIEAWSRNSLMPSQAFEALANGEAVSQRTVPAASSQPCRE